MRRELVKSLESKASWVAGVFSNPNRDLNRAHEVFSLQVIQPLSESSALVSYLKSSGKLALAFFYHVNVRGGEWFYFFPTDSHLFGLSQFLEAKRAVEKHNFEVELNV